MEVELWFPQVVNKKVKFLMKVSAAAVATWQKRISLFALLGLMMISSDGFSDQSNTSHLAAKTWYQNGLDAVLENEKQAEKAASLMAQRAKNVILFVGDGMGVSTVTAARILEGQQKGLPGEGHRLYFEKFPYVALSKTYNVNQQTPDSAGTMTAMMTGIKTDAGVVGVDQSVVRGRCSSEKNAEIISALELAEIAGLSTGVVTTARVTHATPAATYAHSMERDFEHDANRRGEANCIDIARQLIEWPQRFQANYPWVDGLEVVMGGGRRGFLSRTKDIDPETGGRGERRDGRQLTKEWLSRYEQAAYIWNLQQFKALDLNKTQHLLALFEPSHMKYETDRSSDKGGEPSLSEMTAKALALLSRNKSGFMLVVEAGRIDHAHHQNNAHRALVDTIALAKAVEVADQMTKAEETLIIVTADHSHVFTIGGYPVRGNPILGKVVTNDNAGRAQSHAALADDGLPYTAVGYTNGYGRVCEQRSSGKNCASKRRDLTEVNTASRYFRAETPLPFASETHGAEDVAIYATGAGSSRVSGVMEQNAIYHVINRAAKLEQQAEGRGWQRK